MHLRELQTILGPGGSRQSAPQGRGADGADGTVHLHLGGDLVPRDGPSPAPLPLPALVHEEGRTLVRGHADDPEASQLRRKDRATAAGTVSTEDLDCPAHRAPQPNGLTGARTGDFRLMPRFAVDPPGGFPPLGPLADRLRTCETRTEVMIAGRGPARLSCSSRLSPV